MNQSNPSLRGHGHDSRSTEIRKKRQRPAAPAGRPEVDEFTTWRLEREQIARETDAMLRDSLNTLLTVPRAYIPITGSILAAIAAYVVQIESQAAERDFASPWARMPEDRWRRTCGMSLHEWQWARADLRQLQVIAERRYYDIERGELATEYRFNADVFRGLIAEFRAEAEAEFLRDARAARRCARDQVAGPQG